MKIPLSPPSFEKLADKAVELFNIPNRKKNLALFSLTSKGKYLHWDELRHRPPPEGLSSETWWLAIKFARRASYKSLPFKDKVGNAFNIATPDTVLQKLHMIDRQLGNTIQNPITVLNTNLKDSYSINSLIEEAITSSQLEGASTTSKVAKEMLRVGRKPQDISERMIFNNYQAMEFVREIKNQPLTVEIILELHKILTQDTLDNTDDCGKVRTTDDIHVWDYTDQILHTPPKAKELKTRLIKLCEFANKNDDENYFMHPIIKAILLHFMLAYDHPFIDGNGRTARALFYWSVANQNYSLMEFISISEIIKRAPIKYAKAYLYTETDDNDLTYFIIHQLDVILKAIEALYVYLDKQRHEIMETEQLLFTNPQFQDKLNYRQVALIKHALKNPETIYQIEIHRKSHNVTYDTARNDLLKLEKFNLLVKRKRGKAFTFIVPKDLKKRIESFYK